MEKEYREAIDSLVIIFIKRIINNYQEFLKYFGFYCFFLVMMIYCLY